MSCFLLTFVLLLVNVLHVHSEENSTEQLELYEDKDYKGLLWTGPTEPATRCYNLYPFTQRKTQSLKTPVCVVLFSREKCLASSDYPSFVLTPGDYPDLSNVTHHHSQNASKATVSFRECGDYEGDKSTHIRLYGNSNGYYGVLLEYFGIKECTNLPTSAFDRVTAVTTGNCFKLYDSTDCNGAETELKGGTSIASENLYTIDFANKIRSIAPCK